MEWVAQITKDHLYEKWKREGGIREGDVNHKDKLFAFDAMCDWWGEGGWNPVPKKEDMPEVKTAFKLYDDDDELYYSGWLLNDDECIAQSFVLKWAEADSGCTKILVHVPNPVPGEGGGEYKQEIA